jgi:tetratricopeptide (TPR) repeat protein
LNRTVPALYLRVFGFGDRAMMPWVRWTLMAAVSAAALGGGEVRAAGEAVQWIDGPAAPTLSGSYLSGRAAQRADDWAAAADFTREALERDPRNPVLLQRTFILMLGAGRTDEARTLAERLSAGGAEGQLVTLFQIAEDVRAGRAEPAADRMRRMSREGMGQFLHPLLDAWVTLANGDADRAVAALAPLERTSGLRPLLHLHTALIREQSGNLDAAAESYAAALEAGPALRVVQAVSGFYRRTGRAADADAAIARFMATSGDAGGMLDPGATTPIVTTPAEGMAEALFNLAVALDQEGADETALFYARIALHLRPDFAFARLVVGDVLTQRKRHTEALVEFRRVAEVPALAWTGRLRIADSLANLKREDEARDTLTAMAQERPDRTDALVRLGDLHRQAERFAEAVGPYTRALERTTVIEPRHWGLFYARGIAHERSKQWPQAEADFLKALELSPEQPYVLNYLGYSWIDRGENLERGREMVERAVRLRPNDGHIVDSLGWAHFKLGNLADAVRYMERAVELKAMDPVINDHLGDVYWAVGRYSEARFQWERALLRAEEADLIAQIREKLGRSIPRDVAGAGRRP